MQETKKSILIRVYLVYLGILLFAVAIIGRVVMIQSFESTELMALSKKQELRWFDVEAIRGNICSDNGTLLATSIPIFDIRMDVCTDSLTDEIFHRNVDSLATSLSSLFRDRPASTYRKTLLDACRKGDRYLIIKRKITYPQLREVRTFPIFKRGKYKGGLIVIPHYKRELPYKELARRTIGYESKDETTRVYVGLEGFFSKHLQGVTGKRLMRRIGNEAWVPVDLENELEPQNGDDIITTIDINIQDLAERALLKELIADSADHGCVVVMEVKSGHIKAIANLKRIQDNQYEERYNYAVGESTEPGSTFKLASFLVALEGGKIDLDTPVETGKGKVKYSGRTMSDSHRGGYGTITAQQVFEKSSNVGTSKIIYDAYHQKPQEFIDGLYKLGIQYPLGLQISGEGKPYIKDTKDTLWSRLSLPWMSIGYEVAMTPIQILTLYNAIANNGVMIKPLFVKEIRRNGEVIQVFRPEIANHSICSGATLKKVKSMMQGVVDSGTAMNIKSPVYSIAGKTGTAQVAQNNRGYGQTANKVQYKGSFVGFFPADNPKYSMIVVINNPGKSTYYGAFVAGPVFKEIADQLYASHPEVRYVARKDTAHPFSPFPKPGETEDLDRVYTSLGMEGVSLQPREQAPGTMPDVTGMGLKDALYLLEQNGLEVTTRGKGFVIHQSIPAGNPIEGREKVFIDLKPWMQAGNKKSKPEA